MKIWSILEQILLFLIIMKFYTRISLNQIGGKMKHCQLQSLIGKTTMASQNYKRLDK
jgi:hypothetical protein